uniref:Putative secreted protein n=1 Tax=Anopheles darlingi TaxID=43151 RepID=A0A2M4D229_ANODA
MVGKCCFISFLLCLAPVIAAGYRCCCPLLLLLLLWSLAIPPPCPPPLRGDCACVEPRYPRFDSFRQPAASAGDGRRGTMNPARNQPPTPDCACCSSWRLCLSP